MLDCHSGGTAAEGRNRRLLSGLSGIRGLAQSANTARVWLLKRSDVYVTIRGLQAANRDC